MFQLISICPLSRARNLSSMMMFLVGEGWGEGMSRMVIDDEMWSRLEKLLSKPKDRHGRDDRLFMEAICWTPYWCCMARLATGLW